MEKYPLIQPFGSNKVFQIIELLAIPKKDQADRFVPHTLHGKHDRSQISSCGQAALIKNNPFLVPQTDGGPQHLLGREKTGRRIHHVLHDVYRGHSILMSNHFSNGCVDRNDGIGQADVLLSRFFQARDSHQGMIWPGKNSWLS